MVKRIHNNDRRSALSPFLPQYRPHRRSAWVVRADIVRGNAPAASALGVPRSPGVFGFLLWLVLLWGRDICGSADIARRFTLR